MAEEQQQRTFDGYLAEIVEVQPRKTGMFGSIIQVMCKILEGKDKGRVIRRNISGRAKPGDMIRLGDTSREDKPITVK
jgi:small subunit ribosomal protein S28e